jgi:hypothetical protein
VRNTSGISSMTPASPLSKGINLTTGGVQGSPRIGGLQMRTASWTVWALGQREPESKGFERELREVRFRHMLVERSCWVRL